MSRMSRISTAIAATLLVAIGVWLRLTSPTSMPQIDADEAFFGVQANRILEGRAPALWTYTGNVVSPLNAGFQIPLIAAFGPKWWILRAPTIASGILAIFATAWFFRRSIDRRTAWLAAVLIAVLPVAIVSSRIGYDAHLTPFLSVIVLGFAFQGRGLAMTLAWLAALSAHPTNLFLLPIALPVFLLCAWRRTEGEPRLRLKELVLGALIPSLIGLAMGIAKLRTPKYLSLQAGPLTGPWMSEHSSFASSLGRILLGVTYASPDLSLARWLDLATIAGSLILAAGVVALIRQKKWDQAALILGSMASLIGFRVVGGPNSLLSPRYVLFAAVPIALALACSVSAIRIVPSTPIRRIGRGFQVFALGLAGIALVGFSWINGFQPFVVTRTDSPWTPRVDREDSYQTASILLLNDGKAAEASRKNLPVYADSEWVGWPLMYLTAEDSKLSYSSEWAWKYDPKTIGSLINQSLYQGGYAVGAGDGPVAALVETLHPIQALRRWDFQLGDQRRLVVYRLNRPGESSAVPVVFKVWPVGKDAAVVR